MSMARIPHRIRGIFEFVCLGSVAIARVVEIIRSFCFEYCKSLCHLSQSDLQFQFPRFISSLAIQRNVAPTDAIYPQQSIDHNWTFSPSG
jgi:hypothetical protein